MTSILYSTLESKEPIFYLYYKFSGKSRSSNVDVVDKTSPILSRTVYNMVNDTHMSYLSFKWCELKLSKNPDDEVFFFFGELPRGYLFTLFLRLKF